MCAPAGEEKESAVARCHRPPSFGRRPPPSPSQSSQDSQLDADVFAHDKLKTSLLKTELQQFKMQQM